MPRRWSLTLVAILAVALVAAIAAAALPDDPYMRFASLDATIQNRIRWIYERTHFDPAPIDVVVVGPSRSGAAVNAPRLEADLARLGRPLRTVNFSLPENGRDLNWVILQQVFATKRPKLVVIGVIERPSRFGHPAYKYVAPAADVVDPAYFGNLNYPTNLIYLPYRQLRLALARIVPGHFGLPTAFDRAAYPGSNDDTTVDARAGDGTMVIRDRRVDPATLAAGVERYEAGAHDVLLGRLGQGVEFGDDRTYVARMARLARDHGARVAFVFLPYYTGPATVEEAGFYRRFGPLLDAHFVADHDEWFSDYGHLNTAGALVLTDWLAPQVAAMTAP